MSDHVATIQWQRGDADFTGKRYSRRHEWHFDGGAVVAGSSSPHVVREPFSDPSAVDPEEAFVASLSSCHMLWFLDFAARAGWAVESYRDEAIGTVARDAAGKFSMTVVTLRPVVTLGGGQPPDLRELQRLHHQAHAECFLANSVKTEVRCEPSFAN
jgi:organic hydroperoxide reductase OsmC/OhrA